VELAFGQNWRVKPSEALLDRLRDLAGPEAVQLRYEPQAVAERNSLG
jgi:hypothetical protein